MWIVSVTKVKKSTKKSYKIKKNPQKSIKVSAKEEESNWAV